MEQVLTGKAWNIPEDAKKPERSNKRKSKGDFTGHFTGAEIKQLSRGEFIIKRRLI